jgi:hypothetical protein
MPTVAATNHADALSPAIIAAIAIGTIGKNFFNI